MSSLYIDRKGSEIKLSGEALVCYENEERIGTIPLAPIERIYLKGDVKLQASLLAKLGERNIGIICLSGRKNEPTLFMSQPHNDAERRLAQYELANNEAFCLSFAQKLLKLKLITQKNWLWQASNARLDKKCLLVPKAEELDSLIAKINEQTNLPSLRGIEGRAAAAYFTALSLYLPPSLRFNGRNRRPPKDPFNAVLSLSYTLLHSEAVLAIYGAGLDPFIGFFHSLDYGRESLACDLIEPLRPLVDNWLLGCFRKNRLREEYFSTTQEGCFLGKTGRVHFYQEYEKAIGNWRKMLEENCRDLVNLLKSSNLSSSPQRRSSQYLPGNIEQYEENWKKLLENYYFNQRTMLANYEFYF
ncbi:CRISPR-associated endonuclease Cas1 [Caviibacterium pharyngocola]|uniref:CRISPR-associated endonuclease Cas1 n=1 Tax=Caviibacterium pharyngocola TaxID=28159 RepID=A0A2M8RU47_9PAST|nr:CRISPR-associated endonuclease Cas1 [Caviibacterium pharyngocola]PJG82411.1 CRISPR-associated endonuclease Cas1 [Caviibacterium pharyngocola]